MEEATAACSGIQTDQLFGTTNAYLKERIVSSRWKVTRPLLVRKGKSDSELPSPYLPLCVPDMARKVMKDPSARINSLKRLKIYLEDSSVSEQGDPQWTLSCE